MMPLQRRQAAAVTPSSSQTQLANVPDTQTQTDTQTPPAAILRLRGGHNPTGRSVQWREDVVDNEGLGRKKSKVCCIYHRPRGVNESSDESSSDSSSSSDSESDGAGASSSSPRKQRAGGGGKGKGKPRRKHDHDCHHHDHDHGDGRRDGHGGGVGKRRSSPNAYEKIPKYKPKDSDAGGGGPAGPHAPKPAT